MNATTIWTLTGLLLSGIPCLSATAQEIISASPDITIDLGPSVITADENVAVDNQLGIVMLESLGAIPDASDVIALGLDVNGDRLIAFDTTTGLAGGVVARPGDVIRYDGASYSIEFDASAAGIPTNVMTDATSLAAGGLLLSFDTTVDLGGGLVVADEDLVRWDGSSFSMAFDGSLQGLDAGLDIDAAQDLGGNAFAMSFDTTGEIAGLVFADEDVLRFDGTSWTLEFDGSAADPDWAAADLDAVMVPEPAVGGALLFGALALMGFARWRLWAAACRPISGALGIALMLASAGVVVASDGVLEINQACAVSGGCFAGDASGFPVEITQPGSYRLTGNLDIRALATPENITVILLKASDVSLDLNGFAIVGAAACSGTPTTCTGAGTGVGINAPIAEAASNIRVQNGTIRGMGSNAIQLENTAAGPGYQVTGIRAVSNAARGIRFSSGSSSSITDCLIESNGTFGISAVGSGGGVIANNVVSRNGSSGVNAPSYLVVGNSIMTNALSGLTGSTGYVSNVFAGNTPDVSTGNVQLGPNLCSGALCP